jgi:hypothetical protein
MYLLLPYVQMQRASLASIEVLTEWQVGLLIVRVSYVSYAQCNQNRHGHVLHLASFVLTFQKVVLHGHLVSRQRVEAAHHTLRGHLQTGDSTRYRNLNTAHMQAQAHQSVRASGDSHDQLPVTEPLGAGRQRHSTKPSCPPTSHGSASVLCKPG